jgi:HSP20 family protein
MKLDNLIPWNWHKNDFPMRRDMDSPFVSLQREMNRLFDNFSHNLFQGLPSKMDWPEFGVSYPQMDIKESDKEILVTAELPGIEDKDIDISLSKNSLTIKGEKKVEKEEKKSEFYRMERSYGSFQRTVPLPAVVKDEEVKATFKNGVLTVIMPKSEKALKEAKKIKINTE